MRVQLTVKAVTYLTMEVEVPAINDDALNGAMHEIMEVASVDIDHDNITEYTTLDELEIKCHAEIEDWN